MRYILIVLTTLLWCCAPDIGTTSLETGGGEYENQPQCNAPCGHTGSSTLICHYPPGNTENPQTICVSEYAWQAHVSHEDSCGACGSPPPNVCGDGNCAAPENCGSCSEDCGVCPPPCGDGVCEISENCMGCPEDCDECGPLCGDSVCEGGETCESCASDCGYCEPSCGDDICDDNENCRTCKIDCGECPGQPPEPECSDGTCDIGEDCETCADDCGNCTPTCGDGVCDEGEACDSCPGDCGQCSPPDAGPSDPGDAGFVRQTTVTGGELGGCSTGGAGNTFGILIIAGAAFLMRRKKSMLSLLVLLVLTLPSLAMAQVAGDPGDFKLERFDMAMDGNSIITVEGAEVGLAGSGGLNFFLGYANDPLVLQENTGDGWHRAGALVGDQVSGSVGIYNVIFDNLSVAIDVPVVLYQGRDAGELTGLGSMRSGGMSDPRYMMKYQFTEQNEHLVSAAVGASLTMPWPTTNSSYINEDGVTFTPYLALSKSYDSAWRWSGNFGIECKPDTEVVDLKVSDELFGRFGVAKGWNANEVGVTLSANTTTNNPLTGNTSYAEMMAQYSRKYGGGWSSFLGAGTGLNQGFGAPDWRAFAGMRLDIEAGPKVVRIVEHVATPPQEEEPTPRYTPTPGPEKIVRSVLTVPDMFFSFDKDVVLPQYRAKLELFAKELLGVERDHPEFHIFAVVSGHTDSLGPSDYNLDLSERRVKAVIDVLIEFGVPEEMINFEAWGEHYPRDTNSTDEGRATNRRVEVYIGGEIETLEYYDIRSGEDRPGNKDTYDSFGTLDEE